MSEKQTTDSDSGPNSEASEPPLLPPILPSSSGNPFSSMTPSLLQRKGTSNSSDSGNSSGNDNDNNASDNSALVSIGNNSFGFNFPNESSSSNGSDSDGGAAGPGLTKRPESRHPPAVSAGSSSHSSSASRSPSHRHDNSSSEIADGPSTLKFGSKDEAPDTAVTLNRKISPEESAAMLKSIASACGSGDFPAAESVSTQGGQSSKRGGDNYDDGSEDSYNTDNDDDDRSDGHQSKKSRSQESFDGETGRGRKRSKKMNDKRREERNAREKERSFRIAKQINELRELLSAGGVILPKGTKSSVLTEAASYIRLLQQHQLRSEIERHQLIQQMHVIGGGAHGTQAAQAIRHAAAQNGVWSLGNFGGVPPKSAMFYPSSADTAPLPAGSSGNDILQQSVSVDDYRFIFNSAGVGMAVSSMGGSLIDCNELFSRLSGYSKQELSALTIFNLTARCDLQSAFDLISQMISPPIEEGQEVPKQVLLRGTLKHRSDLGLSVSLVKGDTGVAKCFCITLIKCPTSPFSVEEPVPVSFEAVLHNGDSSTATPNTLDTSSCTMAGPTGKLIATTPAFTSG